MMSDLPLPWVCQMIPLDVAVVIPFDPIAEIGISQGVAEQGDDARLGFLFDLADGTHVAVVAVAVVTVGRVSAA
ncbi:MAG: hypothetical protein ACREV1_07340 [Gammaproteobacteria bacterium]